MGAPPSATIPRGNRFGTEQRIQAVSSAAGISHTLLEAMDDVLERIILGRLDADDKLAERTRALVIGACHGAEALDATLEGETPEPSKRAQAKAPPSRKPGQTRPLPEIPPTSNRSRCRAFAASAHLRRSRSPPVPASRSSSGAMGAAGRGWP